MSKGYGYTIGEWRRERVWRGFVLPLLMGGSVLGGFGILIFLIISTPSIGISLVALIIAWFMGYGILDIMNRK